MCRGAVDHAETRGLAVVDLWLCSWCGVFKMAVCLMPFLAMNQAAATALTSGCQCEEKEESGESRPCSLDVIPENQYPDGPDHFGNFSSMASRTKCNFWNCSWSLTLQLSAKDVPAGSVVKQFCTLFSKKLSPGHCLKLALFSAKCDVARGSDSEAPSPQKKFSLLLCQLCLFATTNIHSSNHLQFWRL